MKVKTVKDLMVPLSEYATVAEDASLYEAVMAIEAAKVSYQTTGYRHRAVLIYDQNKKIVGKLSQLDVIKALEPKYDQIADSGSLSRFGFSRDFLKTQLEQFHLWNQPMDDICRKARQIKVREVMYTPTEREYVEDTASLNEAIHQLIMGHHQSLLVTHRKKIVGVLRTSDIFQCIYESMQRCELQNQPSGS